MNTDNMNNDEFISSHNGQVVNLKIVNSYEIWKNCDNKLYVKMKILKNKEEYQTFFDHEDLDKINKYIWIYNTNGYVVSNSLDVYIHNLIVNNEVDKYNNTYVEHHNGNKLDNRKINLITQQILDDQGNIFISSHKGHKLAQKIRNSYEIWKDINNNLYVKMNVFTKGEEITTLFDYDDLPKVKSTDYIWSITKDGYVTNTTIKKYLHHLVMNFVGTGKGFQKVSVDHIDTNTLDNRKFNLRLATPEQQHENRKGRIEGTKCNRQITAVPLPDGIDQDMMPKYVSYRIEPYKEYFVIEKHPAYINKLKINGKPVKKTTKSTQALWVDQHAKPQVPYPIMAKLDKIKIECAKLDEIYKIWNEGDKTNNNIITGENFENEIITKLVTKDKNFTDPTAHKTGTKNKKVYKYDTDNNLVDVYDSIVNTADINVCDVNSIRRAIKSSQMFRNNYYRTTQI